jgi:trehalose/maltose hydrolase-like predicted phosphorylase
VRAVAHQSESIADGLARVERIAAYVASADTLPDETLANDRLDVARALGFDSLLSEHVEAWDRRWEAADVVIHGGGDELQLAVRFALFHLMASVGREGEAAVGARGLSGPGYAGHVFWDADV